VALAAELALASHYPLRNSSHTPTPIIETLPLLVYVINVIWALPMPIATIARIVTAFLHLRRDHMSRTPVS
jgi:hypothetical protein